MTEDATNRLCAAADKIIWRSLFDNPEKKRGWKESGKPITCLLDENLQRQFTTLFYQVKAESSLDHVLLVLGGGNVTELL
jgi:hypothetical protein